MNRHLNHSEILLERIEIRLGEIHGILKNIHQTLKTQMTPEIVKALIDALNSLAALIATDNANVAASQKAASDAQAALATLQATDAALQDPALVTAANAALAAASAANPPAPTPTPAPAPTPATPAS